MENSLKNFLLEELKCRYLCDEEESVVGVRGDFTVKLGRSITTSLHCKQGCSSGLSSVSGEQIENFLPELYNYLQIAYYNVGDLRKACSAVASYLLFLPTDKTMLYNKLYYTDKKEAKEEYFIPREEAKEYHRRDENEKKLLQLSQSQHYGRDVGEETR